MTTRVSVALCLLLLLPLGMPLAAAAPGNDDFDAATPLSFNVAAGVAIATATQSTAGAGTEGGEQLPCGSMGATVWFTFTAPLTGLASAGTEGSSHDTAMAMYEGDDLASLAMLACNDDTAGFQSHVVASVSEGGRYAIQVGGYGGETGSLELSVVIAPAPAIGGANKIQPGDSLGGFCTLNFVFDDAAGNVFIGTAAHCVNRGDSASTDGFSNFGTVVVDLNDNFAHTDIALIKIAPTYRPFVSGEVLGHPGMPNGYTTSGETTVGDLVHASGYGIGADLVFATRENRPAFLVSDNANEYTLNGAVLPGDSGGPFLHAETGKALGIVSRFNLGLLVPTTDAGPTVEGMLNQLSGMNLALRTA